VPVQYRPQCLGDVLGLAEVAHVRPGQFDDSGLEVGGEPLRCFVSPVAGSRDITVAAARCEVVLAGFAVGGGGEPVFGAATPRFAGVMRQPVSACISAVRGRCIVSACQPQTCALSPSPR
jgi:hypothetical protein